MEPTTDVLIAGGGQAGLALALALRQSAPTLHVVLIDAAPPEARAREGRASTIVAGGQRMLAGLGVWPQIAGAAQRISAMEITDSRTSDAVRPVLLTFALEGDADGEAYVIGDGIVAQELAASAQAAGATILAGQAVVDLTVAGGTITARLADGAQIAARLVIAADGARSKLRDLAGITTVGRSYGQSGIVVTVVHERPHGGVAYEHFLPGGPFAALPMTPTPEGRNRSSLVWTEPTDIAERLVGGDRLTFQVELERRFGHRLGAIEIADTPQAFPLGVFMARAFTGTRLALVGDAAHVVHPIAGQGLNLAYRDVAALAETIVEAHRLGLDVGAATTLARYQQWRRADTLQMALATDGLNRLFANDDAVLRISRDIGLGLVDRLPELKRFFIRQASGTSASVIGPAPRLMRGEAI
jgi:2-octaprenyl-6-methoxyphenol hydroxylase